jgi:RNA polymerase sigma-70 factor (ECF subfamily)
MSRNALVLFLDGLMHAFELPRPMPVLTTRRTAATGVDRPAFPRPADAAAQHVRAIRAVAAGNRDAFAQLYADYVRMVHAIVLGRVPRAEVDDRVQDVFVIAYTRLRELRDPAAFGGWLAAIARNRATDHLRHTREQVELPEELPGGDPIEAETFAVLQAVRLLPEAYRETLLMRLVEGMTGQEIADRTGLSAGSVRVNLHRGMKLLREKLGWTGHE